MDTKFRMLQMLALIVAWFGILGVGLAPIASARLVDTAAWVHESGGSFGAAVATGDVNCDGTADLIVGTPQAPNFANDDGKVEIWFGNGQLPAQPLGPPNWTALGAAGLRMGFGASVAIGDLDGNGCGDLIVGAPDAVRPRIQLVDRANVSVFRCRWAQ